MFKKLFGKKDEVKQEENQMNEAQEALVTDEEELTIEVEEAPVLEEAPTVELDAVDTEDVAEERSEEVEVESSGLNGGVGFFKKLKNGLEKTRKGITDKIDNLINNYGEIDDDLFEELEEIMITSDIGMETTMMLIDQRRDELVERKIKDSSLVKNVLKDVMEKNLNTFEEAKLNIKSPTIILVIGVNGAGKTTTIGKLAYDIKSEGKNVLLAAGDTFRAAAIDQLKVWGERADVEVIAQSEGSDTAAVIFDSIQAAKSRNTDVLICDTAGRLHNKVNLMNELNKVFRIVEREYPEANKEVLLVLDATTGQNAIQQAKLFKEVADITGIVLTKLDGTAKGGVVLGINRELGIPVKLIGVGEGINDMHQFVPHEFVSALLNEGL